MRLRPTFDHPLADRYLASGGPWDVPTLDSMTGPEGGSVVDGDSELSGAEVDAMARSLAGGLRNHGVGRGDVVAWQLPNWHEAVLLYRACWLVGAIAAPVQHRFGPSDLAPALELLDPVVCFSGPGLAMAEIADAVPVRDGTDAFERLLADPVDQPSGVRGADIAAAVLTSGSTGTAKAVLMSHRALAYKVRVQVPLHGLGPDDVLLTPAPLSHVSGLLNGVLLSGAAGLKVVLMESWDPTRALGLIERHGVTYMGGPVVFLTSMTESPDFDSSRVRSLRVCSIGGSSMTSTALARLGEQLGCVVKRSYGMTEVPTVAAAHDGDPTDRGWETDGRAVGAAEIIVVDPSSGKPLDVGREGEVWLRGPEMFSGYAVASQTEEAIAEGGWFRTGDLGVLDEQGWLRISGRIKELIIRGGENIATAEIEELLESHPDVRQAVAVGFPDDVLGERVAAVVVADAAFGLDECRGWFAERGVAKYKTPEAVVHVEEIALNANGKPDRIALKALAEARLVRDG